MIGWQQSTDRLNSRLIVSLHIDVECNRVVMLAGGGGGGGLAIVYLPWPYWIWL